MDQEVWDQLSCVDYGNKIRDGFADYMLYGTVIYQGPFNNNRCNKVRNKLQASDGSSVWVTSYTEKSIPDFKKINPWLFFPDYRALKIKEAERATVVNIMTAKDLRALAKREGFFSDQISDLLKVKPNSTYYQNFRARAAMYDNIEYLEGK